MHRFVSYVARNHLGLLALFIALGGTSYAVINLPRNSVGSKQIKNRQVKRPDIAKDAVTSSRVKNFSLRTEDFMPGQLPAGPPGRDGADGTALAYAHVNADATLDPARSKGASVTRGRRGVNGADMGPQAGTYCFQLSVTPGNAVASPDSDSFGAAVRGVDLTPDTAPAPPGDLVGNTYCPAGYQDALVTTGDAANPTGGGTDRPFYVLFN
jgi:hypothetical protein